jgi:hypothetical protein
LTAGVKKCQVSKIIGKDNATVYYIERKVPVRLKFDKEYEQRYRRFEDRAIKATGIIIRPTARQLADVIINDIIEQSNRLTTGNVSHGSRTIHALAVNLKDQISQL